MARPADVVKAHDCFSRVRDRVGLRTEMLRALGYCFPRAKAYFFPRIDDRIISAHGFDKEGRQYERVMPGVFEVIDQSIVVGKRHQGLAPFPYMPPGYWLSMVLRDDRDRWGAALLTGFHDEPDDEVKAIVRGLASHAASLARAFEAVHELAKIANTDSLTNAMSRRAFMERLERVESGILFYIDLDDFKNINDTHGHVVGDQLLIKVVQQVKDVLRRNDCIGRMGGDEFAVLMPLLPESDAVAMLSRLTEAVFSSGSRASIGWSPIGSDALLALHRADERMYSIKRAGKNSPSARSSVI